MKLQRMKGSSIAIAFKSLGTGFKWSRIKGEALFAFGTVMAPVANLIAGIVSAKSLTPSEMGVLSVVSLLPSYLRFMHCGVFTGLARNMPIEIGAGRTDKAERLARTSAATATIMGLAGAAISLGMMAYHLWRTGYGLMPAALGATSLVLFSQALTTHMDTEARARQDFRVLPWALIWTNVIAAVSSLLVAAYDAVGGVLRLAICSIGAVAVRMPMGTWSPRSQFELPVARELASVGFPLLLSGTLFGLLSVADRSLVSLLMSTKDVGNFSLASMIVGSLQSIPQSISMVLFPKMAKEYGRTKSLMGLRRYIVFNLMINVATIVPISVASYFAVGPLVSRYFPAYIDGIDAAKTACLTSVFWVYLGVGSVFGVANRMRPYLMAMALSIAVVWVSGAFLILAGYGIRGASWARLLGTVLICVFTIVHSFRLTSRNAHIS